MLNLGINTVFPACCPVNSLTSRTLLLILVTTPLEPLQTPSDGSKLRKIITGHPIFNFNFASGNPEQLMLLRYSTEYIRSPSGLLSLFLRESALMYSLSSLGNCLSNSSLMSSTSSLQLVKIVRSAKYWSGRGN